MSGEGSIRPLPQGACDCHFHAFEPARWPYAAARHYTPPAAPVADYLALCERLGIARSVLVHPTVYDADHRSFEDMLALHGPRMRGVAVVGPDTPEDDIARWHRLGARGTRITTVFGGGPALPQIRRIAERVKPFGWHLQLLVDVVEQPDLLAQVRALGVEVVADHMGHHAAAVLRKSAGFANLCAQLAEGAAWAKLSAPYRLSAEPATDPHVRHVAQALARSNPQRIVWGTDWPHPSSPHPVPPDEQLVDLLFNWLPDAGLREAVLVHNPGRLYWGEEPAGA